MKKARMYACAPVCVHACLQPRESTWEGDGMEESRSRLVMGGVHLHPWRCKHDKISLTWKSLEIKAAFGLPTHSFLSSSAVIFKALTPGVIMLL